MTAEQDKLEYMKRERYREEYREKAFEMKANGIPVPTFEDWYSQKMAIQRWCEERKKGA